MRSSVMVTNVLMILDAQILVSGEMVVGSRQEFEKATTCLSSYGHLGSSYLFMALNHVLGYSKLLALQSLPISAWQVVHD
jgi:hypothetical protein